MATQHMLGKHNCLNIETAITGYHWSPVVGELFVSLHQSDTPMPREFTLPEQSRIAYLKRSHYCPFFTLHKDKISGGATGSRRHSSEAGGHGNPVY